MILLLDTSTTRLAIGIATDRGDLAAEFHAEAAEGERGIHDARLAVETERLLNQKAIAPKEISRIGLIIGPGSFTGIRIGLSFAKGFAFATGATLVPLTQHEVMADEHAQAETVLVVAPGYREDLFYIAECSDPRNVRLADGNTLVSLRSTPMIVHDSFAEHPSPYLPDGVGFAAVSLHAMARLTAQCTSPLSEFDDLEPLYLT